MSTPSLLLFYVAPVFFLLLLFRASAASLHGVAPQDEKYFASAVIRCRDGSGSFSKDRLNDEFCDCLDGTDEPGTSACPQSKFYCKNAGDSPRFLFSSFVNDRICDCCDGSDEYESGINCPNTCQKMKNDNNFEESNSNLGENSVTNIHQLDLDDLFHKLKGLRIALILEIGFVIFILAFCLLFRRTRSRRRRYSLKY